MTEDEITEDDFENFDEKSKEEKMETLRSLHNKLADGEDIQGLLQNIDVEGELTVKVFDEDGNKKQVETQEFEA